MTLLDPHNDRVGPPCLLTKRSDMPCARLVGIPLVSSWAVGAVGEAFFHIDPENIDHV
jgi:hypothetical protein